MTVAAHVVRRFNVSGTLRRFSQIMEAPAVPARGAMLDFGDGTGAAAVAFVRLHLRPVDFRAGFYPTGVEIHTETEPADRLPATEAAGWKVAESE